MKRVALAAVVALGLLGSGVVLAAPSGVSREVVAQGKSGDVRIDAKGPLEVRHGIATVEPGGTTGWASWPGDVVATVKEGGLTYRNGSNEECPEHAVLAGTSFLVPAGSVFEVRNPGSETAKVHTVAFLPPGQELTSEEQPANC